MRTHGRSRPILAALWLGMLWIPEAMAFTFTPMTASLEPQGAGATKTFQLQNDGDTPTAVEITLYRRSMDVHGKESLEPCPECGKSFLVFPAQLTIKPREKRSVRISWVGGNPGASEQAYRIVAEQLPVTMDRNEAKTKTAMIKLLMKYVAAVYVTPSGAKPSLKLVSSEPQKKKPGVLDLEFKNEGNAHILLNQLWIKLTSEKGEVKSLGPKELPTISGQNILAGATRRFAFTLPPKFGPGPVKVEFEIKE